MEIVIQYAVIGLVFIVALVYLTRKFLPSKNKQQGCGKGCGCSMMEPETKK